MLQQPCALWQNLYWPVVSQCNCMQIIRSKKSQGGKWIEIDGHQICLNTDKYLDTFILGQDSKSFLEKWLTYIFKISLSTLCGPHTYYCPHQIWQRHFFCIFLHICLVYFSVLVAIFKPAPPLSLWWLCLIIYLISVWYFSSYLFELFPHHCFIFFFQSAWARTFPASTF